MVDWSPEPSHFVPLSLGWTFHKAARGAAEDARAVAKASGDAWHLQRLQFDALDVGHVGGPAYKSSRETRH